ncbi:MAG: HlyD family efflux transporter periplasmic adaptor subunit [Ignavibacteriota bacterium]|nr:MAG: HlyD family efflux transporter periplasmic adaptor subunit [Chlorobiota bacterium]MBE7475229.1 efflux RND transporter periplasmic adaptor subunit [Ignavibacteriales bacterium]MBL1122195.1 HlyD family efflux transporter periplasmic adaptor subunit [Ignavibacteriota bacterium]MCC7095036.1 efflux RND transporter periplasmic adaptor subunit [Ignavibacteriaceae bacterium]MCE7857607.1 HlyD family efflux transporter periplasmic adaptor subunit [Ignavibacteria bacterium CHB3]MEB2296385.1 efflu
MRSFIILSTVTLIFLISGCGNNKQPDSIDASGTIESTNVIVSAKTSGEILMIKFTEGSKINAGDTILIIDHEHLDLQLLQAIAVQNAAEAQLRLMQKGAREEDIIQAEQNLNQAKVNLETAEKDKIRMQNLFDTHSITQKQYEDAAAKYDLMNAQYKSAQENYAKVKKIFRPEEIDQAKANLDKAVAGVELLQKNIRDSYVTSPINGFLVKTFIERGESVIPMSSLFKVSDLDIIELEIYISEEELGYVKLGQKADISVDSFKDKTFEGKVTYISPEAEFTPKNIQTKDERTKLVYAVKITIQNKDYYLKSGMPADAVIRLQY